MNQAMLTNTTQNNNNKSSKPIEDHLNTLADIIIERILEEKAKKTAV